MNAHSYRTLAAAIAVAVGSSNAWALTPQSIDVYGLNFTPTVTVAESHDSNIHESRDKTSSWVTRINPSFALSAETAKSGYQLRYDADNYTYHSAHKADHTNQHLAGDATFEFDARNRLKLNAGYNKLEQTTDTAVKGSNDKLHTENIGGVYTYGARSALIQVDLGANFFRQRYENHLDYSIQNGEGNRAKNYDATTLNSIVYYRIAPKTQLLGEVRHTKYDYQWSESTRNSKNWAYLIGAKWEATAQTTGTAKLGYERKRFDQKDIKNQSSPMWEVGVEWAPLTYSTFGLNARRAFDEGDDGASVVKNQTYNATWKHYWLERLYSDVSYTHTEKKYQDQHRTDKLNSYGVGLNYEMRRWLDVGIGYSSSKRDSDLYDKRFNRNIWGLTLNASL